MPLFGRGGLRHVQRVRQKRAPQKAGPHRPENVGHFLACEGISFGVLRLARKYYKTSEFRKPYLKSGNSSKTAFICNADFMVSCSSLMSENCEAPHFYRELGLLGFEPIIPTRFCGKTMWLISNRAFSTRAFWCHVFFTPPIIQYTVHKGRSFLIRLTNSLPSVWLNRLEVSALGIRARGPRFDSRIVLLFHWVATLAKLFTHIASPVSQLQETGVQKREFWARKWL